MTKHLLPVLLLMTGLMASASPVTPDQALRRAKSSNSVQSRRAAAKASDARLAFTQKYDGADGVYVFNSGSDGFLILPADDAAPAVLGYGDKGHFDSRNIPDNMKAWLEGYAEQILQGANSQSATAQAPAEIHKAIAPLCKTEWSQDKPFNSDCPMILGKRPPVGCVATAMAQIMKFYNYPAKGKGSHSYNWTYNSKQYSLNVDFSQSVYDWDNMLDSYAGDYTTEQAAAVAKLSSDCGVASDMAYAPEASGTSLAEAGRGLVQNLGYDKSLYLALRYSYTAREWDDMVYGELSQNRPVFYAGEGQGGAHAFVCDGYDDGYYHFNWGWGGMADGYFLLTAMEPPVLGIGGGTGGGFTSNQQIILNLIPDKGTEKVTPNLFLSGQFLTSANQYNRSGSATLKINVTGAIINFTPQNLTNIYPGVKLANSTDTVYVAGNNKISTFHVQNGFTTYEIQCTDIPVGNWVMTPAYQYDGKWYEVATARNSINHLDLRVTNTRVNVSGNTDYDNLSVYLTDVKIPETIYAGKDFQATATVTCRGIEFYGAIRMILYNDDQSVVDYGPECTFVMENGEQIKGSWVGTFAAANGFLPPSGTYNIAFVSANGIYMSDVMKVKVAKAPAGEPEIAITLSAPGAKGFGSVINPYRVDFENATFEIGLSCKNGYFADNVAGALYENINGKAEFIKYLDRQFITLDNGQSTTITISQPLTDLDPSKSYWFGCSLDADKHIVFTGPKSGINDLDADQGGQVTIYDISGQPVQNPGPGVYIVKIVKPSGVVTVKKVIR